MKILQINTTVNSGSTGRIAEDIGNVLIANGHESYIAFGRGSRPSTSHLIKIGNSFDIYNHVLQTRLFDRHGLGSKHATLQLINKIEHIKPDVIGLQNIHGYYLNYIVLFKFLRKMEIPVVWTLHDAWSFTGHCTFYDSVNCLKWLAKCYQCPKSNFYPESWFFDRSTQNFIDKKTAFCSLSNLTLITPSAWLAKQVKLSFLNSYPVNIIHNGIDLASFKPFTKDEIRSFRDRMKLPPGQVLLGVASIWDKRKGLDDFIELSKIYGGIYVLVLIGLSKNQIKELPSNIIGIERTESIRELALWYNLANVFINPTYQDNFPTTNIEALACGTPVITYNTGGSPEAIDAQTGIVVEKGDISGLYAAIRKILINGKAHYTAACRARAESLFNKDERYTDYLRLYEDMFASKLNSKV